MTAGRYSETLRRSGFPSFLTTQFLGAFNDNFYKMIVSLLAADLAVRTESGSGQLPLVGAVFMLPFFLFSGYAGHLADVFSKRAVLIVTKAFEIAAMALAVLAFRSGRIEWMLGVVFLMALQSTFFSPAKYGILPEMLPDKDLSRANGFLEMSTFLAIILGTSLGGALFAAWRERLEWIGIVLTVIAVAGTMASFGVPKVPPSGARKPFRLNPWSEIGSGIRRLYGDKTLWLTVVGISYFWFLGALLQMDVILFGKEILGLDDFRIGLLGTFLAIGIGAGSLASGRLSGDKVELGLVPLGSIGLGVFSLLLASSAPSYAGAGAALCLLGFSAGFFIVPLNAILQQRSGRREKGQLIATANFLSTAGILLASGALWLLRDLLGVPSDRIILFLGLVTLVATVYILTIVPDFFIRFILWLVTHTIYRIDIAGQENVPVRGPALLVCNHLSHVDALIVASCVQRFIRFMIYRPYYDIRWLLPLFRLMKAIPVSGRNRREIVASIAQAREELSRGHVVCIFAEGAISRTGNLLPFKRGFEKIVEGMDIPIVPVYLDRLWGSVFSFKKGKFLWKWPERLPYPVTVIFGAPLPSVAGAAEARQAMLELGSDAVSRRIKPRDLLHLKFVERAKRRWFSFCMADSTGQRLNYGRALIASLLLARRIAGRTPGEEMVGLLLPASVGAALANVAALMAGKIPVNLNFTAGREAMMSAIRQCGIKTVITSKPFLGRAKLGEMEGMVFLEEELKKITRSQKVATGIASFLLPAGLLGRLYRIDGKRSPESIAAVIFSSGSTGAPKGVMLSHRNILANLAGIGQLFRMAPKDRVMGVLPFFHSFGFTGTLWFPLVSGFGAVYHPNPLDAKTVGEMVAKYQATILITTPTFCAAYLRKCSAEEFSSLRYAIVGGEKLRGKVAEEFREKYGLDLLEGYGCTEMAPVIAVNIPDVEEGGERHRGVKPGTVGHPLPGVAVKVVNPETGEALPPGQAGLLLAKGPNRMVGYLGQPEKTAEVLRDGWYVTGDIAAVDEEGFIRVTDRLSRISKIGGEMVPHVAVEEAAQRILGDEPCVVTAVPDERKGERLVVFYTCREIAPEELWKRLSETDLPNLWLPKRENIRRVDAIPLLGSGKVDLKKVKSLALESALE